MLRIRRRKAGVRYCERITEEHKTISRSVWHKRLVDAANRVETAPNGMGNIDDWAEMMRARLIFAHVWYQYKLRYERISTADFQAYIVMTTI